MAQADFAYQPANDVSAALAVSIYADRPQLREQMRDDAIEAGLVLREVKRLQVQVAMLEAKAG